MSASQWPPPEDFDESERSLYASLPRPRPHGAVNASQIWIIEWLCDGDRTTGKELHDWVEGIRPGWAQYTSCQSSSDVIAAMQRASESCLNGGRNPILHIESHGGQHALVGRSRHGGREQLVWRDLTPSLQQLNLASGCNLLVFFAACTGFAGIQALCEGPLAPAVALVGPDDELAAMDLLQCSKEFYRRLLDTNPELHDAAASASNELTNSVGLAVEPFAVLCYETFVGNLIRSLRQEVHLEKLDRLRQLLVRQTELDSAEIERRLMTVPHILPATDLQRMWDTMFMIDIYPDNQTRFGLDVSGIVRALTQPRTTHRAIV